MYSDSGAVDVLMFVEHRDRELESAAAIARELRQTHRCSVAIASSVFQPVVAALTIRPRVVVAPSMGHDAGSPLALCRRAFGESVVYINLNLEQMLSGANRIYRQPRDEFAKRRLKHFCWGTRFREFLLEHGVTPDNIRVTGRPATRLLMDRVRGGKETVRAALAARFDIDAACKWVYLPLTCRWAFASDYHIRTNVEAGYDPETAVRQRKYVTDTVNEIFRWTVGAVNRLQHAVLILRPHPSVSEEQYTKRFRELFGSVPPRICITKQGNAHDWLVASDVCLTNFSSLALDAASIRLPAYLLAPEPFPDYLWMDWFEGLPIVSSSTEFEHAISDIETPPALHGAAARATIDTGLDGVVETAAALAEYARTAPWPSRSVFGLLTGVVGAPRRTFGGLLRWTLMRLRVQQLVRAGVRPDYFSRSDVEALLAEASD